MCNSDNRTKQNKSPECTATNCIKIHTHIPNVKDKPFYWTYPKQDHKSIPVTLVILNIA